MRDPTAYVKRTDLATERGFDADFNFLTGVERSMERAGRVVENRGMDLEGLLNIDAIDGGEEEPRAAKRKTVPVRGEVPYMKAIENGGVKLVKAPKGIARQRQNQSGWHRKHKCINWYIEWILPDGKKECTKALETADVASAFARTAFGVEHVKDDRRGEDDAQHPRKKRRVEAENDGVSAPSDELATEDAAPLIEVVEDRPIEDGNPTIETPTGKSSGTVTPEILPLLTPIMRTEPAPVADTIGQPSSEAGAAKRRQEPEQDSTDYHFYLHRPRSRSKFPVLIPLSRSAKLTDALRGRTILEFPTLYVLDRVLPGEKGADDKFVLEEQYLNENPDEREAKEAEKEESPEEDREVLDGSILPGLETLLGVDEAELMKVMQQDLGED